MGPGDILLLVLGVIVGVVGLIALYSSITIVGGTQYALLERKYLGKTMPQGRVVAFNDEVGIQARTLGPGLHIMWPFIYSVSKFELITIQENEVGQVEAIDGQPIPDGSFFAVPCDGHSLFQDGEAFLKNGGQKGPQLQTLPPGTFRINPYLFRVRKEPVVLIGKGTIGQVEAIAGQPIAPGRLLAAHVDGHNNFQDPVAFLAKGGQKGPQIDILLPGVYRLNRDLFRIEAKQATVIPAECIGIVTALDGSPMPPKEYVANSVEGHKDFQDGSAFLANGGQRGPQLDVLRPGTYYINPYMFSVAMDKVTVVQKGQCAVVISNVGKEPQGLQKILDEVAASETGSLTKEQQTELDKRLDSGIERYVVGDGYRGVQREVLGPGVYYLNKLAFIAYIVDTTNVTIDWDDSKETRFDPLSVVSKDGFSIGVSVKVVVRVRPDQAPYMVAKIGSIENLVLHVIHPMIDSSFRNQASSTPAMKFLQDRQEEQTKAEERARLELDKYHVECVSVLICQIELPAELMETQTKRIIADQQMAMYDAQKTAEDRRVEMSKAKATADKQPDLVTAQINVQIAGQKKEEAIIAATGQGDAARILAEGQAKGLLATGTAQAQVTKLTGLAAAEVTKVTGDAEASAILAKGSAQAKAYQEQQQAVTAEGLVAIEVAKVLSNSSLKLVPDTLIQTGEGGSALGPLLTTALTKHITKDAAPKAAA